MDKSSIRNKILKLLKAYRDKYHHQLKYSMKLVFVVIVYGVMISFILNQFFNLGMSLCNIVAYGFVAYIIKVELPFIIASCFPKRPPVIKLE